VSVTCWPQSCPQGQLDHCCWARLSRKAMSASVVQAGFGVDVGIAFLDVAVGLAGHVPAPAAGQVVAQHGGLGDADLGGKELDTLP
jgi:hypothetical protein